MSDITVIGAGITGPMAALTAAQAGHNVTVYEQRPADELHSIGILGITEDNWQMLQRYGVDLSNEITDTGNIYRDTVLMKAQRSPFHWIVWSDLHNAVTRCAYDAGAHFRFQTRASVEHARGDYVFDAGGVVSAVRRGLPNKFIHQVIYRGISPTVDTDQGFTTYKLAHKFGFLDYGHTRFGAAWAFGVHRDTWPHRGTTFTDTPPPETYDLPADMRDMITSTGRYMVLPQYSWTAPAEIWSADWRRFSIGDANGAVRPLTTSGANLGLQSGNRVLDLMAGNRKVALSLQERRAYALDLGLQLTGPEIGGDLEDTNFAANQRILYGWDD